MLIRESFERHFMGVENDPSVSKPTLKPQGAWHAFVVKAIVTSSHPEINISEVEAGISRIGISFERS